MKIITMPVGPPESISAFGVVTQIDRTQAREGWLEEKFSAVESMSGIVMKDLPCATMELRLGDKVEVTVRRLPRA